MNKLTVKNMTFSYGKNIALDNINLDLEDGLVGLLGKNGAGKTTLMKVLVTLYESKLGNTQLNNFVYGKDNHEIRRYIGYLQQDFDMYKNITGNDYLEFVASSRNLDNKSEEIKKTVNNLNLNNYIDKKIRTYSGGIKRRLGIAQAIIGNTKLVVLDEPTVGLDPEERNEFRKIIKSISKDRIVIMSTHITEDIEFLCDKLVILHNKTISFSGKVNNFIQENSENICVEYVDSARFNEILETRKVISYKNINKDICVKYIDKNINILCKDINLQDSYMNFLGE